MVVTCTRIQTAFTTHTFHIFQPYVHPFSFIGGTTQIKSHYLSVALGRQLLVTITLLPGLQGLVGWLAGWPVTSPAIHYYLSTYVPDT